MLFFLLALWRESWLAVVEPSPERLNRQIKEKQEVKSTDTERIRGLVCSPNKLFLRKTFLRVPAKFPEVIEAGPRVSVRHTVQS